MEIIGHTLAICVSILIWVATAILVLWCIGNFLDWAARNEIKQAKRNARHLRRKYNRQDNSIETDHYDLRKLDEYRRGQ